MKIRVLVVEDEPPIQRSICQKIEESNENYIVVAAIDNGKDAIQYLKEYPVDVMFVDMNLPIVSGKELLKFCYAGTFSTCLIAKRKSKWKIFPGIRYIPTLALSKSG